MPALDTGDVAAIQALVQQQKETDNYYFEDIDPTSAFLEGWNVITWDNSSPRKIVGLDFSESTNICLDNSIDFSSFKNIKSITIGENFNSPFSINVSYTGTQSNSKLEVLDISKVAINDLYLENAPLLTTFKAPTYLRKMTLKNVGFSTISFTAGMLEELEIEGMPNLTSMDAKNNLVGFINGSPTGDPYCNTIIKNCPKLATLNLQNNEITEIDLGNLPGLKTLNLSKNHIYGNVFTLSGSTKLESIDLGGSYFKSLDITLKGKRIKASLMYPKCDFYTDPYITFTNRGNNTYRLQSDGFYGWKDANGKYVSKKSSIDIQAGKTYSLRAVCIDHAYAMKYTIDAGGSYISKGNDYVGATGSATFKIKLKKGYTLGYIYINGKKAEIWSNDTNEGPIVNCSISWRGLTKDSVIHIKLIKDEQEVPDESWKTGKAGWKKLSGNNWRYYNKSGNAVIKNWSNIKGKWYYFGKDGLMAKGWLDLGAGSYSLWYYLDPTNGDMQTGWLKNGASWYYLSPSGAMVESSWQTLNGKWYHFSASGRMQTGWAKVADKQGLFWYYFDPVNGDTKAGSWVKSGANWYYMDPNGRMQEGWLLSGSKWYYLQPGSGAMVTGHQTIGGKPYYFSASGAMQ